MRSRLLNLILVPAALVATAIIPASAMAAITLNVPFSFTAGGKTCPAGHYVVDRDANGRMVTLKSLESPKTFSWLVGPGDPAPNDSRVVLQFDELDGTHALRSIQYGPMVTSKLDKNNNKVEQRTVRVTEGGD